MGGNMRASGPMENRVGKASTRRLTRGSGGASGRMAKGSAGSNLTPKLGALSVRFQKARMSDLLIINQFSSVFCFF
jgi:hypothetical protein